MSDKYKHSYRGYLCDHHSPDPPVVTLENLNVGECEKFLLEADVDHVMVYTKDHWGNSYYDTEIGKKHPGLGKRDWIAEIRPVLLQHHIEFTAYYCFEYDNYIPQVHPEWSCYTKDGEKLVCGMPDNSSNARWGMPCLSSGYRHYAIEQLKEVVKKYHPDSLFIDIFGKSLCYCDRCRKNFREKFGYELPETKEMLIKHNSDVVKFLDDDSEELLDEVKCQLKAIDPALAITVNFSSHYRKSIRDKLDYMYTEPWAGIWLSGAYTRDTSNGKYPQLGPGTISEVYNYQPESIYELAAAEIAAQNCHVFMYSESMRKDGHLEMEEAKRIGKAYREIEQIEPYLTDREVYADVCIVQSDTADTVTVTEPVPVRSVSRTKISGRHRDSLLGAMKLCDYAKVAWCIVPEEELTLEKMQKFSVVILTNMTYIRDDLARDLRKYVSLGGNLLVSGESGLYEEEGAARKEFALADLMGISFQGIDSEYSRNPWTAYLTQEDSPVWLHSAGTMPPVKGGIIKNKICSAKSLSRFMHPAVALTETTWVNWGSPLPGDETEISAITENIYGEGKVISFCFDFFALINQDMIWTKSFFCDLLSCLFRPGVYLITDHKDILEYSLYRRRKESVMIFHELSALARKTGGDTSAIQGGELLIRDSVLSIHSVEQVYPEKKSMDFFHSDDGYFHIPLESVQIHNIILVKGE